MALASYDFLLVVKGYHVYISISHLVSNCKVCVIMVQHIEWVYCEPSVKWESSIQLVTWQFIIR